MILFVVFYSQLICIEANRNCILVESDYDSGCCFNEPVEDYENTTKYVDEYFHEPFEIWSCKNFTRRNETCYFGPDECTYEEKCVDECKYVEWPGKCSTVSHVIPGSCHEWCEGKNKMFLMWNKCMTEKCPPI